ncbi:MAG: hypothetical protein LLG14_00345 [Nocardiaceae bacterium]|nr:hypothetical protein [Nocardiaceae bacterium]
MTTYGRRTKHVWKTIETIARGEVRPRRLILWLDEPNPSQRQLRRLRARGLEIRECADYGPHKKYYPYVKTETLDVPLATADDDVYYPTTWLKSLVAAFDGSEVVAYRSRVMSQSPYNLWPFCTDTAASVDILPTGVGGVIYPPTLLRVLRERGTDFTEVCPRADDVWLHYAAAANGIHARQVKPIAMEWWPQAPKSDRGLWGENMATGNDLIIEATARAWQQPVVSSTADAAPRIDS